MEENFQNVLRELECPVCNEYMHTVIPQCTAGHSICKSCEEKCPVCPIWKSIFHNMRNYTLEKVICAMKFSCKNEAAGCNVSLNPIEIHSHLQDCDYELYACPLIEALMCSWTGKEKAIREHVKSGHSEIYNKYDSQNITPYIGLISCFKSVFKVYRRRLSDPDLVQWSVQYVGSKCKSENYLFRVEFVHQRDVGYKLTLTADCIPLCNDDAAFDGDKVCVHEDMLKYFKVGDNLQHRVFILLKKNQHLV